MLPTFIVVLSAFQALANQFYILLRRADAGFGLLLKGVKNIDGSGKSNRVNTAVSVAPVVFHNFKNTRTFAFPGFGMRVFSAELGKPERITHFRLNRFGESLIVLFCRSDPVKGFLAR